MKINVLTVAVACLAAASHVLAGDVPELRVGDAECQSAALKKVAASYPAMARSMSLAGSVELEIVIGTSGSVEKTKLVKGHALLAGSATNAAMQWKFKPFTVAGKPARAIASMVFNFKP